MQIILKELCWGFGKTELKFQRRFRIANRSVAFLALLYSGLVFFPQLLFAHSYSYAFTPTTKKKLPHRSVKDDQCWKDDSPTRIRSMSSLVTHEGITSEEVLNLH